MTLVWRVVTVTAQPLLQADSSTSRLLSVPAPPGSAGTNDGEDVKNEISCPARRSKAPSARQADGGVASTNSGGEGPQTQESPPHGSGVDVSDDLDNLFSLATGDEEFVEEVSTLPDAGITAPLPLEEEPLPASQAKAGRGKGRATVANMVFDERTAGLIIQPGGQVEWSLDTGIATRIPAAFKFNLKSKATVVGAMRRAKRQQSASAQPQMHRFGERVEVDFLHDSGAQSCQIPSDHSYLLHDIKLLDVPVQMQTSGADRPTCTQSGTLVCYLQGIAKPFRLKCLINPGLFGLCILSADVLEAQLGPGEIRTELWNNRVMVSDGTKDVPVLMLRTSVGEPPYLRLHVVVGGASPLARHKHVKEQCRAARQQSGMQEYDLVHRLCGHAHADACVRTANKAKGLPPLSAQRISGRPCPACAMGKMAAPRQGQGNLSTGLRPTKPGEVFCGDVFGPVAIAGLAGERYFVIIVCQKTGYGLVRCCKGLEDVSLQVQTMIIEARVLLAINGSERITLTMYSDNASIFTSAHHKKRLAELNVQPRYAAPYEARTNPYAERFGGVLLTVARSMLLEGSYPPKFWSIIVPMACWTVNRVVRQSGDAPFELFTGKELDFSKVHPTGTLCYWHVDKKHRDDPKLGSTAAVGVYLGPGEAVGSRGHLVFTTGDRVRAVSHVLIDDESKPFQLGLVKELLQKSSRITAVYDKAQIDPQSFVTPAGDSAFSYVGRIVQKEFDDGLYAGKVLRIIAPEDDDVSDAELYYQVVYTDGDVEDFTYQELVKVLVMDNGEPPMASAASIAAHRDIENAFAAFEDSAHSSKIPVIPIDEVLDKYAQIVMQASRQASHAATKSRPANLPFGETYSWMKIFKMSPAEKQRHVAAMQTEIDKLTDAGHAEWAHLPPGQVTIPSVGVFRVKSHDLHSDVAGNVLKARFCANGQAVQVPPGGWDSTANVASCSQLLTVIALAAQLGLNLMQIDVKSAFTQVKLRQDQKIWIRPLPGLGDPRGEGRSLHLLHHLYGHPLANAAFQDRWVEIMVEFGFKIVDRNRTVFSYESASGERLLVATVVDDSIVAYNRMSVFRKFEKFLEARLPITVTPLEHMCGLKVVRKDDGSIEVDQQEYIEKKAAVYECMSGKWFQTPIESNFVLGPRPDVADKKLVDLARELMGSLIYATLTRPDCKFACSKLASVVINPTPADITAMKRILRYLYVTRTTKVIYRPGSWTGPDGEVHAPLELSVYVDAGFAQEEGRKSQTGFALFLGGAAVHSKSGRQTQVSDSTAYSETIALHEAANWAVVFRKALNGMFAKQRQPTKIYEDNEAAKTFALKGPGARSLHWDVKLEYVHELVKTQVVDVKKIDTKLQVADVLTKGLLSEDHLRLSAVLLGGPVVFSK